MALKFDPQQFPDRVIVVDAAVTPPVETMNCLGCGKMTGRLFRNDELCEDCYRKWSIEFCREWVRVRFGTRE